MTGRHRPRWRDHALLTLLLFGVALAVRVLPAFDRVFLDDYVRFRGTDAWYRMRLVENLLANFPHGLRFDPYLGHPGGDAVREAPLFDFLLALPAWVAGLGQPSAGWIEACGAWLPALLGALVAVPVYLAAQTLWGRPAGLIAGAVIAVLPGRFLDRSLLGAADHHVAEVWWSTCCLLFLLLALRAARERSGPRQAGPPQSAPDRRTLGWAVLAGTALAAYMLSWRSGSALPCLLLLWALAQYAADLLGRRSSRYLAGVTLPMLAAALIVVAPWLDRYRVPYRHAVVLALALLVCAGTATAAVWWERRRPSAGVFLLAVAAAGIAVVAVVAVVFPTQIAEVLHLFGRLEPAPWGALVAETRPLHLDDSLARALWREFTTAAPAAGLGLALLAWRVRRAGRAEELLVLVWSLAMLALSLGQRRFTYYLAVAVALAGALAACWLVQRVPEGRRRPVALAALCAVLLIPNARAAMERARRPSGPDPAWHAATAWLRANSPPPFADPDLYWAHPRGPQRAAYGVLAWWDRGFWILRGAHRVPVANPKGRGIPTAAAFYLAQEESEAQRILDQAGARYVIVDDEMPIRQAGGSEVGLGTLASMARWLGQPVERYVERYELRAGDGTWRPIFLYYPAYFRTLAVRLQTFSGEVFTPRDSIWVVSFREDVRGDGSYVKRITGLKPFGSHRQAVVYLERQPGRRHRLVSTDPAASCVPLEAVGFLGRVYPGDGGEARRAAQVQIFEHRSPAGLPVP